MKHELVVHLFWNWMVVFKSC